MNYKKIITLSAVCGLISGLAGSIAVMYFSKSNNNFLSQVNLPVFSRTAYAGAGAMPSFVGASAKATPCVVFIKTVTEARATNRDPFFDFFSWDPFGQRGPSAASGSGVILSADGYIVTNNHVIDGADNIEVITNGNKRSYKARVIGADPNTDLALIKIQATDLPFISIGNSEQLLVGDWVMAVGNPFNLTSTVTAGIVSAKGRNINIVNTKFPIESFIQTDAAINPGNSGGALIDLQGNLVGINTAIASNTGSYNGYGFAIPIDMVSKIVEDLKKFGEVQRGYPGMEVKDIEAELAEKIDYKGNNGVYVNSVMDEGPAKIGGLQKGDIIIKAGTKNIDSKSVFDEQISLRRPGDELSIIYMRKGVQGTTTIKLFSKESTNKILYKNTYHSNSLNSDLTPVTAEEKEKYSIDGGIKIDNIIGGPLKQMGLQNGSIILKFNNKTYNVPTELEDAILKSSGSINMKIIDQNGNVGNYSFLRY